MINDRASLAFSALGNTTRLQLFRLLVRAGEVGLNVSDIKDHLNIPGSTLAHHLSALTRAGLVSQTRKGRQIVSVAEFGMVNELIAYLTDECCQGVGEAPGQAA